MKKMIFVIALAFASFVCPQAHAQGFFGFGWHGGPNWPGMGFEMQMAQQYSANAYRASRMTTPYPMMTGPELQHMNENNAYLYHQARQAQYMATHPNARYYHNSTAYPPIVPMQAPYPYPQPYMGY